MKMTRSGHKIAAWIACFAIMLAALAPSISHAIASVKGIPHGWIEVCTNNGARLVKLDGSSQSTTFPDNGKTHIHFEHCPFCQHHHGDLAIPSTAKLALPTSPRFSILPTLFYQASRPLFAWSIAHPRAPPRFS